MEKYTREDINKYLVSYGLPEITEVEFIDSSHGDDDVRHNYILDKKYVLRVNSAPVFTEQRLIELNVLIERYREFGLEAPRFLCDKAGTYLHVIDGVYVYLSEYLDYTVAGNVKDNPPELLRERVELIAKFAEKYKNVGLTDTMSMYSLFELSPYDQLSGMDEKQENMGELTAALRLAGKPELAERLERVNAGLRAKLQAVYRDLPRCVFQGDENYSNICVDENGHIVGLFDFNMAGTDVIANYLANQVGVDYTEEMFLTNSAAAIYETAVASILKGTELIKRNYAFTEQEEAAYWMYGGIVLMSQYPYVCDYRHYLEKPETREKVSELLTIIADKLTEQFLEVE